VGVLHDTSIRLGMPSVSLWAAVPHYLPAAPNPKAALALVQRVSALLELPVETAPLDRAATGWEDGVAKLIHDSEELAEYVDRLEAAADESLGQVRMEPASGDAIAAELERFLRDRDQQEPPA
jgi:predicted ATP-grasp superfamily ATP-dependent carboligase